MPNGDNDLDDDNQSTAGSPVFLLTTRKAHFLDQHFCKLIFEMPRERKISKWFHGSSTCVNIITSFTMLFTHTVT